MQDNLDAGSPETTPQCCLSRVHIQGHREHQSCMIVMRAVIRIRIGTFHGIKSVKLTLSSFPSLALTKERGIDTTHPIPEGECYLGKRTPSRYRRFRDRMNSPGVEYAKQVKMQQSDRILAEIQSANLLNNLL